MNKKVEELVERVRLTPEEVDDLTPTKEEVNAYLTEPDDNVAASLDSQTKRIAAMTILYVSKVVEAQLNKVLNDKDLAVIDRGQLSELAKHIKKKGGFNPEACEVCKELSENIIPLAVLKE